MRWSKHGAAVLACLVLVLPAGCWDRREINDIAFVLGSAFDLEDEGYRASIQIVLPSQLGQSGGSSGGGGGTSGSKSYMLMSQVDKTIRMANFEEQLSVSRSLYFAHRRVILIGERAGREGLRPFVDLLGRIPQNRLTSFMITTESAAHPYLRQDVDIEYFPSEVIRELAVNYMAKPTTVKDVITRMLDEGIDVSMPAVRFVDMENDVQSSKKIVKMDGLALYRDFKLVRIVYDKEAACLMMAMNTAKQPEFAIDAPEGDGKIIFRIVNLSTQVKPVVHGRDDIRFKLTITGRATIAENTSTYTISKTDAAQVTESKLNASIREEVMTALQGAQRDKTDPVGFGRTLSHEQPAVWEALGDRWGDLYPRCKIDVNVRIRLGNTGTLVEPLGRFEGGITQ